MHFNTANSQTWNANISGVTSTSGFGTNFGGVTITNSTTDFTPTETITTGSTLDGKYYGTGSVKSVGGSFNLKSTGSYEAFGVFKATK